jgi:hypothetical protein
MRRGARGAGRLPLISLVLAVDAARETQARFARYPREEIETGLRRDPFSCVSRDTVQNE